MKITVDIQVVHVGVVVCDYRGVFKGAAKSDGSGGATITTTIPIDITGTND